MANPSSRREALRLSRREVMLGAASSLVATEWACQAGDVGSAQRPAVTPAPAGGPASGGPAAGGPAQAPVGASKPGGLDVVRLGSMRDDEKGGLLVVLLHGWGARGDDLVSLAQELSRPRVRFVVPAAPLAEGPRGRAWWRRAGAERPGFAESDVLSKGFQPNPQVLASRHAVQAVLRDARERYAPDALAVAGFSQGAMLALDVALAADPPVARAAALSGVLLADSVPALQTRPERPPAIFVSHGRTDAVLPFASGANIEKLLKPHGYPVTFFPFDGGHEIPRAVVAELRRFLFEPG